MTIVPKNLLDKEVEVVVSEESNQVNSLDAMSSTFFHEGRVYKSRDKYSDGWQVLPDVVRNILQGCEDQQRYKMHSYGMNQGEIRVILYTDGNFIPKVGHSGSLEVVYMVEPVCQFLFNNKLGPFSRLENEETIHLIHALFLSIMQGAEAETFAISDGTEISYEFNPSFRKFRLTGIRKDRDTEYNEIVYTVDRFFSSIDWEPLFGKIKD